MIYEYKVIPAPKKGKKAKGARSGPDRFANAIQIAINELAVEGWEYRRAETLPSEEREGLMGKTTVYQNVLIFRRPKDDAEPAAAMLPPPEDEPVIEDSSDAEAAEETINEPVETSEAETSDDDVVEADDEKS